MVTLGGGSFVMGVAMTPEQFAAIQLGFAAVLGALAKVIYEVRSTRKTTEKVNIAVNNRPPNQPTLVELTEETRSNTSLIFDRLEKVHQQGLTSKAWEGMADARFRAIEYGVAQQNATLAEILSMIKEKP